MFPTGPASTRTFPRVEACRSSTSPYRPAAISSAEAARELIGFRAGTRGEMCGTTNCRGACATVGAAAPASIQSRIAAISAALNFLRFPGGMTFVLPSFSNRPSIILTSKLSALWPGAVAASSPAPFHQGFEVFQHQSAFGIFGAVAFQAVGVEDG